MSPSDFEMRSCVVWFFLLLSLRGRETAQGLFRKDEGALIVVVVAMANLGGAWSSGYGGVQAQAKSRGDCTYWSAEGEKFR